MAEIDRQEVIEWLLRCARYNEQDAHEIRWTHPLAAIRLRAIARSQRTQADIIANGTFDLKPSPAESYFRTADKFAASPRLKRAIDSARASTHLRSEEDR